jgi:hypothetical protein
MKRLILITGLAFLLLSCKNGGMETNPYPDGVYPFEVANISHTIDSPVLSITWANPSDSGFKNVQFELYYILGTVEYGEDLIYSSVTGETFIAPNLKYSNFELGKSKFSCEIHYSNDLIAKIKCVDKFGNVSKGVEYRCNYRS